jgi:hypothetical protein
MAVISLVFILMAEKGSLVAILDICLFTFSFLGFIVLSWAKPDSEKYVLSSSVEYLIRKAAKEERESCFRDIGKIKAEYYEAGERHCMEVTLKELREEAEEEARKFLMGFAWRPEMSKRKDNKKK